MKPDEILLKFIQGDDGKKWTENRRGWSKEVPVCNWEGIGCNDSKDPNEITDIDLSDTSLLAYIPDLSQLKNLVQVDLSENFIMGTIPVGFAKLPNLEYVDLSENQLTGTIPIFKSALLKSMNLGYNRLNGTLNEEIGSLHPVMTDLDVMRNKLSGPIPESLSRSKKLVGLSLSQNSFTGTIPSGFGYIFSLKFLYLDENQLVGTIPPSMAREGSILEELWLQNNILSGTIPAQLSILRNLVNLYVDGNKLTGTVPVDLCRENLNADFFEYVIGEEHRDYCNSISCPADTYSLRGIYPCFACSPDNNTSIVSYFSPYLGKTTSCFDMNQRDILLKLFQDTGGPESWSKEENWDVENSFLCSFIGITCDVNNHVVAIDLPNMGLKGTIPQEIGFLKYLTRLDLSNNQLTGFLPSDLRFAPLNYLDISGNFIKGIVPPMLCLKAGINGNGNEGDYNCANIACPTGTFSNTGRRTSEATEKECITCSHQEFLASKSCGSQSSYSFSEGYKVMDQFVIFVLFCAMILVCYKLGRQNKYDAGKKIHESNGYDENIQFRIARGTEDDSVASRSSHDSDSSVCSMTTSTPNNKILNSMDSSTTSDGSNSSPSQERTEPFSKNSVWLDVPKLT